MGLTIAIVVFSLALTVGGFTWAARREVKARARAVAASEITPMGRLSGSPTAYRGPSGDGRESEGGGALTAFRGTIAAESGHVEPYSGERATFWELRLVREDRSAEPIFERKEGESLTLEDASGRITLELEGAELDLPFEVVARADGEPSEAMLDLLDDAPEPDAKARYRLDRRALRAGEPLTVIGMPHVDDEGVRLRSIEGPLLVSAEPLEALVHRERADLRALDRMVLVAVLIALFASAVAIALWRGLELQ